MKPKFNIFHAEHFWKLIPDWQKHQILTTVFCSTCLGSVELDLETVTLDDNDKPMNQKALSLEGKCKICGGLARRLLWVDEL